MTLIASAAMGPRDTSDPISGAVQLPIQCVSPMSAHVADFDTSYYDNSTLSQSDFDARMCENQLHMEGHLILDTGCQTHLMGTEFEQFMDPIVKSNMGISGFDGSKKSASMHGTSQCYFLNLDSRNSSTGQGVSDFTYDTVDGLIDSLFACLSYYEDGGEIYLRQPGAGFSGVQGTDPKTGKAFSIPATFSGTRQAWLVHFVMARSRKEANRIGKVIQKRMQHDNLVNARAANVCTLTDKQALCVVGLARGNVEFRREDSEFTSFDFGHWGDDDDERATFAEAFNLDSDVIDEICQSGQVKACHVAKPGILVNRPKIQLLCEDCRCNTMVPPSNGLILDGSDPSNPTINVSDQGAFWCNDLMVDKSSCTIESLSCAKEDIGQNATLNTVPQAIVVQLDEHSCCLCGVSMTKVNIPDLRGSLKPECARDSSFQGLSTMVCDCNSVCCAATTIMPAEAKSKQGGLSPESKQLDGQNEAGPSEAIGTCEDYELFDELYNDFDCVLGGMKDGLSSKDKKLSQLELHKLKGHVGYCPDCDLCKCLKKRFRRMKMRTDPYINNLQVGKQWGFDLISWKETSCNGNNYTLVMRDYASGYFVLKHIATKNQVTEAIRVAVTQIRNDPRFKNASRDYDLVSVLRCDPAGEQRDDNKEFMAMVTELGIEVQWGDPTDKRTDGFQEQAVKQIELTCKALLAEGACQADWWEPAADQAAEIRNHVPLSRNIKSKDGDAITPIEELSNSKVSRRDCSKWISNLIAIGTPCMVSQANSSKASDNTKIGRHKMGIAYKMLGTLPVFKCPITGAFFRSRNAVIFKAALGESAYEYWGFPQNCGKMPWIGLPPEKDEYTQRLVVTFNDIGHYHAKAMPPTLKTTDVKATGKLPHITVCDPAGYIYEPDLATGELRRTTGMMQKLEAAGVIDKIENMSERDKEINLLKYDPDSFIGKQVYQRFDEVDIVFEGTVQYTQVDSTGRVFWNVQFTDGIPGDYWDFEMIKYCIDKVDGTDVTPKIVKKSRAPPAGADWEKATDTPVADEPNTPVKCDDTDADKDYVSFNGDRIMINATIREQRLEELERINGIYFCDEDDTFIDVCEKVLAEDKQLWPAYLKMNATEYMNGPLFKKKKGKNIIYPGGSGFKDPFQKGVSRRSLEKFAKDKRFAKPVGPLWVKALEEHRMKSNNSNEEHLLKSLETEAFRAAAMKAQEKAEYVRATNDNQSAVYDYIAIASMAAVCELEVSALNVHKTPPPKNYNEAMERDDYDSWLNAACIELDALRERGVLSEHKYTLAECRARGIMPRPMPAGLIFDQKIKPDGETFDKNKGRLVINGTPHNMKRSFGPNYIYETYSSTPDVASNRVMQALMVVNGYDRLDFDIVAAYLAADLPDEERVPIQMQKGMREYNEKGEELFPVLESNLYGSPTACRRFVQMRDEWMIEHFNNKKGWQCVQMVNEKSMFKFTSPEKRVVLACIHSDDVDCVCENILDGMYIAEQFDKRFSPKEGSPGVKINGAGPESNMLGIERTIVKDEDTGVTYVEMTQRGCITDLYEEYKTEMPKKNRETPVPENCFLSTHFPDGEKRDTSEEEIARNNTRGYKHVVGTLLWLARNCFPELSQGLHLLCRVMATPYDEAFDAALHMISYCYGQRERGIRFRSDGNMMPLGLYDASNKPDDKDSKCIAGHVVMLAGGPVIWQSKKAAHVGASSSHNEYMAAFHCAKDCKWIRDLLIELDLGEKMGCDFNQPVVMLGDNDQATRWANLGMITAGNKTVRMNYHWVAEAVKDGLIDLRRVDTVANTSDLFTKSVKEATMKLLRPGLTGYGDLPPIPDKAPT